MIKISEKSKIDLKRLIATRLLINANSGGGKSWAIRRFLEQSSGQVQQIVIDLEGEFSTLREKFDYLLVGKDGEIPTHIRTAEMLAKRLLELNVSTIIDLSELKHPERIIFVKRFLDSLINSPQNLWHPAIIIVDEAHQFCPENSKAESASAVIDLMTRGRKRGFCGVLATQRISKLNKDAAAEANNYLVGRTGLDIDMKRAADILGFTSREDVRSLRELKAGEFYAFGPAFQHPGIEKIVVGNVLTTHPDRTRGIEIKGVSETPANIKKVMKDLVDLSKEADEELRNVEDYKRTIKELRTKLTLAERGKPKIDEGALERAKESGIKQGYLEGSKEATKLESHIRVLEKKLSDIGKIAGIAPLPPVARTTMSKSLSLIVKPQVVVKTEQVNESSTSLRAGAMKMLNWLAGAQNLTKQRLATLSGFAVSGGTFNTYISELKRNGWIVGDNELSITEEGMKNATPQEMPSGEELLQMWKTKFRSGAANILQAIYEAYPKSLTKEEIGYQLNFEPTGGTFNTYISELRRNGLIKVEGETLTISSEFYE